MKTNGRQSLYSGIIFFIVFIIWTILIQTIDVQSVGLKETDVGFATFNMWFHKMTDVNMTLYTITDWLGLVPVFIGMIFGFLGLVQWLKGRKLLKVDFDIRVLGIYYIIVIFCYLIFEIIPINYRPIFINGFMEVSYPSSTTLLVLGVMPTLAFQVNHRANNEMFKKTIMIFTILFCSVKSLTDRIQITLDTKSIKSAVSWYAFASTKMPIKALAMITAKTKIALIGFNLNLSRNT